jgi:hypothetical protein
MTRVGDYTFTKTDGGYVLTGRAGQVVGTFPTARAANAAGLAATAAAYRASRS